MTTAVDFMERTFVTVHVASFGEVNNVMRALTGLPDVIRVEALGFQPGAIRFAVEHEGIVPLDYRLRDERLTPWKVDGTGANLEVWVA
ncbi:MAG: hypothetical protein DWI48_06875 [Chloroflexi bacterium]|nr:MAG: hypothetical protein DWI48_06875 [Chloroflexota bacterium]